MDAPPASNTNWSVYRDALRPLPTHKPRPWERAPVAAHAPRLQGQKIWKKPLRSQPQDENYSTIEQELEGKGSRKRVRAGGKENIGEAQWVDIGKGFGAGKIFEDGEVEGVLGSMGVGEEIGEERGRDEGRGLRRGRKRTNTDHVITPRKPMGRVVLNGMAKTMDVNANENGEGKEVEKPRRRKSMRKSLRVSGVSDMMEFRGRGSDIGELLSKAEGEDVVERELVPASMERQVDFETVQDGLDDAVEPKDAKISVVKSAQQVVENGQNESPLAQIPVVQDTVEVTDISVEPRHFSRSPKKKLAQKRATEPITLDVIETAGMSLHSANSALEKPSNAVDSPGKQRLPPLSPREKVIEDLQVSIKLEQELQPSVVEDDIPAMGSIFDVSYVDEEEDEEIPVKAFTPARTPNRHHTSFMKSFESDTNQETTPIRTPKPMASPKKPNSSTMSQQSVMKSVELDAIPEQTRTPKAKASPRKRNSSVIRRGTRRSTRNSSRASSAKMEEQVVGDVVPEIQVHEADGILTPIDTDMARRSGLAVREGAPSPAVNMFTNFDLDASFGSAESLDVFASAASADQFQINPEDFELPELDNALQTLQSPPEISNSPANVTTPDIGADRFQDADSEPALVSISPSKHIASDAVLFDEPNPQLDVESGEDNSSVDSSPVRFSPIRVEELSTSLVQEEESETPESPELVMSPAEETVALDDLTIIPDSTISDLVASISENAPVATYDHDDTDMLRNFVTRVKQEKAQKAAPKRRGSLPHSPLQLPLGEAVNASPSPPQSTTEVDVTLPSTSPSRRRRRRSEILVEEEEDADATGTKSIRRSNRTRLPKLKSPVAAPSFIPVRTPAQDGDSTVTLKQGPEKALIALTRVNTRKNVGGALKPDLALKKMLMGDTVKGEAESEPAARRRHLQEVFDERKGRGEKEKLTDKEGKGRGKNVQWAEEIAQFQIIEAKLDVVKPDVVEEAKTGGKSRTKTREGGKVEVEVDGGEKGEEKKTPLRTPRKSRIALGMSMNGTPAPKRRKKA